MQELTLILGGFEPVYMQKLALYLKERLKDSMRVGIAQTVPEESTPGTIWVGSEDFLGAVRERHGVDARCVLLAEEEGDDAAVYRYQSCEKLYQQMILKCRQLQGFPEAAKAGGGGRWLVFTSDGASASLLAFSLTCAQILGEQSRVLYLNLTECCGMRELLWLEPGTDLSDLVSALRGESPVCLEAYVRRLEQVDYILPPANPMILPELREDDVERLIRAAGAAYDYVVCALGNTCCGCGQFFRMAARIFHLSQRGILRECSQREWIGFIALCRGAQEEVERICLPQIPEECSGIHLIHSWREGALGQLAHIYLEGEEKA